MLLQFHAHKRPGDDTPFQRGTTSRLPAVLFESPLMAFALTMLVPLIVMLGA